MAASVSRSKVFRVITWISPPALMARLLCAWVLGAGAGQGSSLVELARLDGASGDEGRVIQYIRDRAGGIARSGENGSLITTFGSGSPRTLLVAGVDEPGCAVTGIHEKGYLHIRPLIGTATAIGIGESFPGKYVRVATQAGTILQGAIASPSVHFDSVRGLRRRSATNPLFVDIGARTRLEAAEAGVAVLDRVTLDKEPILLGDRWVSAPWISSRSGAAILLALAQTLDQAHFPGSVALAFMTQMHFHNAGLSRVLPSVEADRVVLLAPEGGSTSSISAVPGGGSDLVAEIVEIAARSNVRLDRSPPESFSFGPFNAGRPWTTGHRIAVLKPATRNRGTPAEAVEPEELDRLTDLLAVLVGVNRSGPKPKPLRPVPAKSTAPHLPAPERDGPLERSLRILVETPGVSGDESRVRDALEDLLPEPKPPSYTIRTDEKGNLIVRLGNGASSSAVFMAHMDEIGFAVRLVTSRGSVTADSKGGGMPVLFEWQPVTVHGSYGTLAALMTRSGNIDFGESSGDDIRAMGVRGGDSVTVPKRYRKLLGSRVSARSLDDRLGCVVLLEVVRRLVRRARRAPGAVEFVFTVEEETGLMGARHYAETSAPARVYPVDTFVTSDSPLESQDFAFAGLGAGPVLRALDESGMTPRAEIARVSTLARRHGIPLQTGVTAGGNDGSVFRSLDTVNIPIGFPLRYAHTPVETADLLDAEASVDLIEVLAIDELAKR